MIYIDPVESALAVIGVEPILSREVEKVRLSDVREMEGLTKRVYAEAKRVVDGEKSSVPLTAVNYKKMLKLLTDGFDQGQLEAMVAAFPASLHEISADFLIKAQQVVKLLQNLYPVATKQTLLGPENILPPALAIRKFAVALDVLNDPMRVFAHIACGSLLKAQATVVKEVYPSFSESLEDAFREAGENAKAKKQSFQLPGLATIGLQAWKGLPRVSPRLTSRLQNNFKQAAEEKDKPSNQASGGENSVLAKEAMTNTQKGLYPNTIQKAG